MKDKVLYLFTNTFPFSTGEQYLVDEIDILAKEFACIYIIPANTTGPKRLMPKNCYTIITNYPNKRSKIKSLIINLPIIFNLLFNEFIHAPKSRNLSCLKKNFFLLVNQVYRYYSLKEHWTTDRNTFYYSYWTNEWSILLSICKLKGIISDFICRIHGYDLIEERYPNKYIPMRFLQFTHSRNIIAVSKNGCQYLKDKYPQFKSKFKTAYLGVKKYSTQFHPQELPAFHLVSCSRIDNNKRVELIANALLNVSMNLHWTHIGCGPNKPIVEKIAQKFPINITYDFKGHVNNNDLLHFYASKRIDAFINVSISEGLPVTMMEILSFGIPLIGTNVGGVSEIINNRTGLLLAPNPNSLNIADAIRRIKNTCFDQQEIINFYQQNFNARTNYTEFHKTYLND